jgi:hypothetical protein
VEGKQMDEEHISGYLVHSAWSDLKSIDKEQLTDDDREKVNEAIELLDEMEV